MIYLLWLLFGLAAALVANSRGGSSLLWFFMGCLFGPFGVLFSFFSGGKQCPFCMSRIHIAAIICPKCRQNIPQISANKKLYWLRQKTAFFCQNPWWKIFFSKLFFLKSGLKTALFPTFKPTFFRQIFTHYRDFPHFQSPPPTTI